MGQFSNVNEKVQSCRSAASDVLFWKYGKLQVVHLNLQQL